MFTYIQIFRKNEWSETSRTKSRKRWRLFKADCLHVGSPVRVYVRVARIFRGTDRRGTFWKFLTLWEIFMLVEKSRGTEFATSNSRYSSSLDTRISLCGFYGGIRQVFKLMLIGWSSHPIRDRASIWKSISAYYQVMSPRHWLFISSFTGTVGWLLLYSASYAPVEYFHYFQYGFGVLAGIGSGFAFGLIILTPQHWLDKENLIKLPSLRNRTDYVIVT